MLLLMGLFATLLVGCAGQPVTLCRDIPEDQLGQYAPLAEDKEVCVSVEVRDTKE